MLYLNWSRQDETMRVTCEPLYWNMRVSCRVLNDMHGWRNNRVVHAITKDNKETDIPVKPMPFPLGKWSVLEIKKRSRPSQAPFVITTDAHQKLDVWKLDADGNYLRRTGGTVEDYQYYIHCSIFQTSLGCLVADVQVELDRLASQCQVEFSRGNYPCLEVTV